MKRKSDRELAYAVLLQERCDDLANFSLSRLEPPEPDVVAVRQGRSIGIEITEIHGNPKLRMTEAEQDRLLASAAKLWEDRKLPPVLVAVHWLPTGRSRKYRDILEPLVSVVSERVREGQASFDVSEAELDAVLPNDHGIDRVFVDVINNGPTAWTSGARWEASTPGPDFYQKEIDRKAAKPQRYTRAYDAIWLLLVHHGAFPSSGFDVSNDLERARFKSPYHRLFLLSLTPAALRELRRAP
jgi:hypothetical protein